MRIVYHRYTNKKTIFKLISRVYRRFGDARKTKIIYIFLMVIVPFTIPMFIYLHVTCLLVYRFVDTTLISISDGVVGQKKQILIRITLNIENGRKTNFFIFE